jgi:C-terminal processing protease CtpA/Prc
MRLLSSRILVSTMILGVAAHAQADLSYQRLADVAKLWAYVKYVHPRVTAAPLEWDKAFADAAPSVLRAKSEAEYAAAVGEMLATLHDPATRILAANEPTNLSAADPRIVLTVKNSGGVALVTLANGTQAQANKARDSLQNNLKSTSAVIFDLRGSKATAKRLPELPVSKATVGPWVTMRLHAGYFDVTNPFESGYNSSWLTQELVEIQPSANPVRPVFLVDRESLIPSIALAMQNSGECAIISEGPITDSQVDLSKVVPVQSNLRARVRTRDLVYGDGTTGVAANVVLNKTGDEALQAAIDIARSGKWPAASGRSGFVRLKAFFLEPEYSDKPYPEANYRLLAAARIWGVFNYFHPYKHLYGEDWDLILTRMLPKMQASTTRREYALAVAEMVTHVHDSHVWIRTPDFLDYRGGRTAPSVQIRWIENQPVVTRLYDRALAGNVAPGDIVIKVNGNPVQKRIDDLKRHISASTPQSLMHYVTQSLLHVDGPDGTLGSVTVRTASDVEREFQIRHIANLGRNSALFASAREGEVFKLVTPKIGYADMDRLTRDQVDSMFDVFKKTDGIILDMRGYPRGANGAVASHLMTVPSRVPRWSDRVPVMSPEPLVFGTPKLLFEGGSWYDESSSAPRYQGKTVMLIDERAISAAETTAMWYRADKGTVLIGSPTAGADGYTTRFYAPGGIIIPFTGADVRLPDGKQLQRVGVIQDIEVHPTVAGIRAGRDEVLERAITYLEQGR